MASARSVLVAAGIEARTAVGRCRVLGDEVSELFGFVVREAVTNVVRHSEARTCTITVTERPGRGARRRSRAAGRTGSGRGSIGLRRRVEAAGGRLAVVSCPGGGTTVTATLTASPIRSRRITSTGRSAVITVLLADDQAMIRQALAALLRAGARPGGGRSGRGRGDGGARSPSSGSRTWC